MTQDQLLPFNQPEDTSPAGFIITDVDWVIMSFRNHPAKQIETGLSKNWFLLKQKTIHLSCEQSFGPKALICLNSLHLHDANEIPLFDGPKIPIFFMA